MKDKKMQKRSEKKNLPASYDQLSDSYFALIVYMIEKVIRNIRNKKILRDPDDRRKTSFGLATEDGVVWISRSRRHKKKEAPVKILIHEVLHFVYSSLVPHHHIYRLEKIFWQRFTDQQKRCLRAYIPKHVVKKEPS